jgi:hypothetical protein
MTAQDGVVLSISHFTDDGMVHVIGFKGRSSLLKLCSAAADWLSEADVPVCCCTLASVDMTTLAEYAVHTQSQSQVILHRVKETMYLPR